MHFVNAPNSVVYLLICDRRPGKPASGIPHSHDVPNKSDVLGHHRYPPRMDGRMIRHFKHHHKGLFGRFMNGRQCRHGDFVDSRPTEFWMHHHGVDKAPEGETWDEVSDMLLVILNFAQSGPYSFSIRLISCRQEGTDFQAWLCGEEHS